MLTLHLKIACQVWRWPAWSEAQDARSRKLEAFPCIQVEAPHKWSSRLTSQGCYHQTVQYCACTRCRMDPQAIQCGVCRTHTSSDVHHQLLKLKTKIPSKCHVNIDTKNSLGSNKTKLVATNNKDNEAIEALFSLLAC